MNTGKALRLKILDLRFLLSPLEFFCNLRRRKGEKGVSWEAVGILEKAVFIAECGLAPN